MSNHPNLHRPKRNAVESKGADHASPDGQIDKPQFLRKPVSWGKSGDYGPNRKRGGAAK